MTEQYNVQSPFK